MILILFHLSMILRHTLLPKLLSVTQEESFQHRNLARSRSSYHSSNSKKKKTLFNTFTPDICSSPRQCVDIHLSWSTSYQTRSVSCCEHSLHAIISSMCCNVSLGTYPCFNRTMIHCVLFLSVKASGPSLTYL